MRPFNEMNILYTIKRNGTCKRKMENLEIHLISGSEIVMVTRAAEAPPVKTNKKKGKETYGRICRGICMCC